MCVDCKFLFSTQRKINGLTMSNDIKSFLQCRPWIANAVADLMALCHVAACPLDGVEETSFNNVNRFREFAGISKGYQKKKSIQAFDEKILILLCFLIFKDLCEERADLLVLNKRYLKDHNGKVRTFFLKYKLCFAHGNSGELERKTMKLFPTYVAGRDLDLCLPLWPTCWVKIERCQVKRKWEDQVGGDFTVKKQTTSLHFVFVPDAYVVQRKQIWISVVRTPQVFFLFNCISLLRVYIRKYCLLVTYTD